jgi:hypothetical protein
MAMNSMVAVLPCNDLAASERFYARLGFVRQPGGAPDYLILADGRGAELHLTQAVAGWLRPGSNPFGVYLRADDVDALAAAFRGETLEPHGPHDKPWGMYEFSLSDPDESLVRVGRPSRKARAAGP